MSEMLNLAKKPVLAPEPETPVLETSPVLILPRASQFSTGCW